MRGWQPTDRVVFHAGLVLVVAASAGCNFGSADSTTPVNSCASDADCVVGVCNEGICIDASTSEVTITVEVLRAPSDTLRTTPASWAFEPEAFSGASERNYTLPRVREVIGVVRWQGTPVPANLRFTRRIDAPVGALSASPVEVDTIREPDELAGSEGVDYNTVLTAGESYDVVIAPNADALETPNQSSAAVRSLPPIYASVVLDDVVDAAPFRFDVNYPETLDEPCAENQLVGCTLTGTVLSFDGENETPAPGLQVRAIEKVSGRVVSSVGETSQLGDFAIRISDVAAPYSIRVTSIPGSAPFPFVSVDPDLAFINDPSKRDIRVPSVDGVQVTGVVRDEQERMVPGANVRFSASGIFEESQLGLVGTFSAATTTNSEGGFSVELLPGVYAVIVTPPKDSRTVWAPLTGEAFVVENATELAAFVLPTQIDFSGSCTTFAGTPASGLTVLARARGDENGLQRSRETASDENGEFRFGVDSGRYDIMVKAPQSTGFPWWVEPELVMSAERGETFRDYTLPPPIVVRGLLQASGGALVGGAQIRAYVFRGGSSGARAIQVAETVSEEDGSYRLLIAPSVGGP